MGNVRYAVLIAALLFVTPSFSNDELCPRLLEFQKPPFDITTKGKPARKWVEVHWIGNWLDFDHGWRAECSASNDLSSQTLCKWLPNNMSFEFPESLPERILECSGFSFPEKIFQIDDWKSDITFFSSEDRMMLLEIDFTPHKATEGAIRLSVFDGEENSVMQPMPSLFPDQKAGEK